MSEYHRFLAWSQATLHLQGATVKENIYPAGQFLSICVKDNPTEALAATYHYRNPAQLLKQINENIDELL